jgi:hypothetical protein
MRSLIRFNARATKRISSGPRSGSGAAPLRLKLSAAFAKDDSGAVNARAAHRPSNVTLMTANSSVIIQGLPRNGGCGRSGRTLAEIIVQAGKPMPILRFAPFAIWKMR